MRKVLVVLVVVALLVGGYYFWKKGGQTQDLNSENEPNKQVYVSEEMPDENLQQIILTPVDEFEGIGNATRSFNDGTFVHMVSASIEDPPEGKFYEGWLVTNSPELDFFSTGKMVKENNSYLLLYESSSDLTEYNEVVITQETESNGLDGIPELHILEGSF